VADNKSTSKTKKKQNKKGSHGIMSVAPRRISEEEKKKRLPFLFLRKRIIELGKETKEKSRGEGKKRG
jgi:hypothetical protein